MSPAVGSATSGPLAVPAVAVVLMLSEPLLARTAAPLVLRSTASLKVIVTTVEELEPNSPRTPKVLAELLVTQAVVASDLSLDEATGVTPVAGLPVLRKMLG